MAWTDYEISHESLQITTHKISLSTDKARNGVQRKFYNKAKGKAKNMMTCHDQASSTGKELSPYQTPLPSPFLASSHLSRPSHARGQHFGRLAQHRSQQPEKMKKYVRIICVRGMHKVNTVRPQNTPTAMLTSFCASFSLRLVSFHARSRL